MDSIQTHPVFRRFRLVRSFDVTGISGTGEIALGVQWPDHTCTLFWTKYGTHGYYKTIGQLEAIHCYATEGYPNARVEWIDKE